MWLLPKFSQESWSGEHLERGAFQSPTEGGYRFDVPARDAQALDATAYLSQPEIVPPSSAPLTAPASPSRRAFVVPDHVATSLDQAEKVLEKIRSRRRSPTGARADYVPPRTRAEQTLVEIWADMLGLARVGLDDDFFALGGHSLLAVRVFDRIGKRFSKHLPIATLFQAPTIRQLAELLTREGWTPSWSSLVPICTSGSRRPFFCVHSLGGNVLNFRLLSRGRGQDQPFYGLQSRGMGGDEAPQESVEHSVSRGSDHSPRPAARRSKLTRSRLAAGAISHAPPTYASAPATISESVRRSGGTDRARGRRALASADARAACRERLDQQGGARSCAPPLDAVDRPVGEAGHAVQRHGELPPVRPRSVP